MILLTGCAGFIGSHTLDRLTGEGYDVVGIDNFDPFYERSLKESNIAGLLNHDSSPSLDHPPSRGRLTLLEGDLAEDSTYERLNELLEGEAPEAIIHLAAKAGVRPSVEDPSAYLRANVCATHKLLDYARNRSVEQFVFASSSSVYGECSYLPWKESCTDLEPISPYAATKLSCEHLGRVYSRLFGIRFLALRFSTLFGPRQRPDLAIGKFANRLYCKKPIPMFGDGSSSRDYTYIDDAIGGIMAALRYQDSDFEIFNLGNHHPITLRDMIRVLETAFDLEAEIHHHPEQEGDLTHTWACLEKSRRALGYVPRTSFQDGMKQFAQWFLRNAAQNCDQAHNTRG